MPRAGSASGRSETLLPNDSRPAIRQAPAGGQLGRQRRILKSGDFAAILKTGSRGRAVALNVALVPALGRGRIGVSASTKVGGSVGRNRARRLVKEGYRTMFGKSAPYDVVVSVNPSIQGLSASEVRQALDEAISSAVARRNSVRRPPDPRH